MPGARKRHYWIQQSVKDESFDSKYALGKEIGRGRSSVVYSCERRGLNQTFAVKVLRKNLDKKVCMADIGILLGLDHENLVRLQEIFESKTRIFIIQELEYGGELFDRIAALSVYTEIVAARAIKDVVSGINYLHNCGYVLKSLKLTLPCHLSLALKLICLRFVDLPLTQSVVLFTGYSTFSKQSTAPEVLKGERYGKPGDMWSVGVILYILLCGYEPFSSDNPSQLFKKILKGQYEFLSEHWENVSLNGQDVIKKLLMLNPEMRQSASAVLRSIWVQGSIPKAASLDDVVMRIKDFNERRRDKLTGQLEVHTIHPNTNPRFLLYV